jgi:hypothetical protein
MKPHSVCPKTKGLVFSASAEDQALVELRSWIVAVARELSPESRARLPVPLRQMLDAPST